MTIQTINQNIQSYKNQLFTHSLYENVRSIDDLHCFLENHIYAVWDFMSLLKALQNNLTCTTTPWLPIGNPEIRYLINEIVVAEETDLALDGSRQSHFEMYLDAMQQSGANTIPVLKFLESVKELNRLIALKKNAPKKIMLPAELVIRESCKPFAGG